ncbi:MAG: general secretion pathway protein GspB [Candidatus Omnitrophica bacterium]|nr:general secretion pathway protein GspB [Candidatus Omnitrophota bacterium]
MLKSKRRVASCRLQVAGSATKRYVLSATRCSLIIILLFIFLIFEDGFAQDEFVYDSKGAYDPFIPLITPDGRLIKLNPKGSSGGLVLEGIMYEKQGDSYAVVNGEILKEGDILGEYQVIKIEQEKVIFSKGAQVIEVKTEEEEK